MHEPWESIPLPGPVSDARIARQIYGSENSFSKSRAIESLQTENQRLFQLKEHRDIAWANGMFQRPVGVAPLRPVLDPPAEAYPFTEGGIHQKPLREIPFNEPQIITHSQRPIVTFLNLPVEVMEGDVIEPTIQCRVDAPTTSLEIFSFHWYHVLTDQNGGSLFAELPAQRGKQLMLLEDSVGKRIKLIVTTDFGDHCEAYSGVVKPRHPILTDVALSNADPPEEGIPVRAHFDLALDVVAHVNWFIGEQPLVSNTNRVEYTPTLTDLGKRVRVEITPQRRSDNMFGPTAVLTSAPVAPGPPVIDTLEVIGQLEAGQLLRAEVKGYKGGLPGMPRVEWSAVGGPKPPEVLPTGADGTYVRLPSTATGRRVRCLYIPVRIDGFEGEPLVCTTSGTVSAASSIISRGTLVTGLQWNDIALATAPAPGHTLGVATPFPELVLWRRHDLHSPSAGGIIIAKDTPVYRVQQRDVGFQITAEVVVNGLKEELRTNTVVTPGALPYVESESEASDDSVPVAHPPAPEELNEVRCRLAGEQVVGKTLVAQLDRRVPGTFHWQRNGRAIAECNTNRYQLTQLDTGAMISVRFVPDAGSGYSAHNGGLSEAGPIRGAPPQPPPKPKPAPPPTAPAPRPKPAPLTLGPMMLACGLRTTVPLPTDCDKRVTWSRSHFGQDWHRLGEASIRFDIATGEIIPTADDVHMYIKYEVSRVGSHIGKDDRAESSAVRVHITNAYKSDLLARIATRSCAMACELFSVPTGAGSEWDLPKSLGPGRLLLQPSTFTAAQGQSGQGNASNSAVVLRGKWDIHLQAELSKDNSTDVRIIVGKAGQQREVLCRVAEDQRDLFVLAFRCYHALGTPLTGDRLLGRTEAAKWRKGQLERPQIQTVVQQAHAAATVPHPLLAVESELNMRRYGHGLWQAENALECVLCP